MNTHTEITGTYGSSQTETTIYVVGDWYACDGSHNLNACDASLLVDGVDVETLPDYDTGTSKNLIESCWDLDAAINDEETDEVEETDDDASYADLMFDSELYDTDCIQSDMDNNNFEAHRLEEYSFDNIVLNSLVNGQISQAKEQCKRYGMDFNVARLAFEASKN